MIFAGLALKLEKPLAQFCQVFNLCRSVRKLPTFRDATTGFSAKWRLRNECRNSILMTCNYPYLDGTSDWLKEISYADRPIRSTTQISVVTRHQYESSDIISQGNQCDFFVRLSMSILVIHCNRRQETISVPECSLKIKTGRISKFKKRMEITWHSPF